MISVLWGVEQDGRNTSNKRAGDNEVVRSTVTELSEVHVAQGSGERVIGGP